MLEAAGVALIQASVGMGEEPNLDPRNVPTPATMLSPRGNLIDFAARIKNAAKIPVTAGGGITPEMREKVLLFCSWPESDAFGTITEKMISGKVLQLGKKGGITEGAKDSPRWVATKNLAKVGSWVIIATESFAGKFAQMVCISQLFRVSNFPRTY